eukprot:1160690-Pelagomonas_calceolata.AAC.23
MRPYSVASTGTHWVRAVQARLEACEKRACSQSIQHLSLAKKMFSMEVAGNISFASQVKDQTLFAVTEHLFQRARQCARTEMTKIQAKQYKGGSKAKEAAPPPHLHEPQNARQVLGPQGSTTS